MILAFPRVKMTDMPNVNPAKFLLEVKTELLKVTWLTKKQVIRLTGVVVAISLLVGLYIGALDFIFTKLIEFFVKR